MDENMQNFEDDIQEGTMPQVSRVFASAEEIQAAREENEMGSAQPQVTRVFGENAGADTEPSGTVEKLDLAEIKGVQAEMEFEEEIEKVKNDSQLSFMSYKYLKSHQDELKEIFQNDNITFED